MNFLFSGIGKLIFASIIGILSFFILLALSPTPSEPIEGFGNFLETLLSSLSIAVLVFIALLSYKPLPKTESSEEESSSAKISDKQMMIIFSVLILLPLIIYFATK